MKQKIKYLTPFILTLILFALAGPVLAANEAVNTAFKPQIIDQLNFKDTKITPDSIGNLVQAVYNYGLGIVGILATLVMMYGGVLYITAAGNASKMDSAKQWIFSSLTGLVLALFSYTLLYIINPNLLKLTPIKPATPIDKPMCCDDNGYQYPAIPRYSAADSKKITGYDCPANTKTCEKCDEKNCNCPENEISLCISEYAKCRCVSDDPSKNTDLPFIPI